MFPCPWCGKEGQDDLCSWCGRSKSDYGRQRLEDEAVGSERQTQILSVLAGGAALLGVFAFLLWVGVQRGNSLQEASYREPQAGAPIVFEHRNSTPAPRPAPVTSPPVRSALVPTGAPVSPGVAARPEVVHPEIRVADTSGSSVRIVSATLSRYDDGSGKPRRIGRVTLANPTEYRVLSVSLTLVSGTQRLPLHIENPGVIAAGGTAAFSVHTEQNPTGTKSTIEARIVLDGGSGAVFDSVEAG